MTLLWEAAHRFAAKSGLHVVPSTDPSMLKMLWQKAPHVAPLEDIPVLQSESNPCFHGEPLPPDDDAPVP